jgi:peroxiredoxin Q/BCP
MKILLTFLGLMAYFACAMCAAQDQPAPKVGDRAPDFKLKGSDGKDYTLAEFRGKQAVIIAWFPKAFTGG